MSRPAISRAAPHQARARGSRRRRECLRTRAGILGRPRALDAHDRRVLPGIIPTASGYASGRVRPQPDDSDPREVLLGHRVGMAMPDPCGSHRPPRARQARHQRGFLCRRRPPPRPKHGSSRPSKRRGPGGVPRRNRFRSDFGVRLDRISTRTRRKPPTRPPGRCATIAASHANGTMAAERPAWSLDSARHRARAAGGCARVPRRAPARADQRARGPAAWRDSPAAASRAVRALDRQLADVSRRLADSPSTPPDAPG